MSKPTIDTAIAAWKAAATQADRDLAAEAIEQHVAQETPEGGDYEAATAELLDRLKAEFGPLPEPDTRQFYIAVPGNNPAAGIFGIGMTEEEAIKDAYRESNTHAPVMSQDQWNHWNVVGPHGEVDSFLDEGDARQWVAQREFVARPCTERLYDHIDDLGCHADTFRWKCNQSGALDDLFDDEA